METLLKMAINAVFAAVMVVISSFVIMLILSNYLPDVSFLQFFSFTTSGILIVTSGLSVWNFSDKLDSIKSH